MSSTSNLLNIAHSGLSVSQKSLATAGHNIANANTEGFSRQRTLQKNNTPINFGDIVIGTGARISSVNRVHDEFLEKKLRGSTSEHGFNTERDFQLSQIEGVFNEIDAKGFSTVLNKFFNSFRELSMQPDDETIRSVVRDSASLVVRDIKRAKESLNHLQYTMDRRIESVVQDINMMADQIASLNVSIRELENGSGETGDLRDQRDLLIKNLSEFFEVTTFQDGKGQYTVNIEGVGSLVIAGSAQKLTATRTYQSDSYNPGGVEVYFQNKPNSKITDKFGTGKIGAIIQSRDSSLFSMQKKIDDLAYDISNSVNAIHRRGFAIKPGGFDAQGQSLPRQSMTGIDFFKSPSERKGAAELLQLSDSINADINNIATALEPNSPGDNRVAIAISKLQHEKVLDGGSATFEESYLKSVGKVGLETAKAKLNVEQSMGILAQNKALKERVSGVSIDEETANMMRYQHVFDASARVMSVADEMFNTVLAIKKI